MTNAESDARACYEKGLQARAREDHASAIAAFNEALKIKPDFGDACYALASILEARGPLKTALKLYEYLLKIAPEHDQGRKEYDALQQILPPLQEWSNKALNYLHHGDLDNAIAAYERANAIHGGIPENYSNLGVALHGLRRFEDALAATIEAIRLKPQYPEAYNTLASIYQNIGEEDKAVVAYMQAIAFKPNYLHPLINLGKLLQKKGDDLGALAAYERALVLDDSHADLLCELLHRLHNLCRWEKVELVKAHLLKVLQTTNKSGNPFIVTLHAPAELQLHNAQHWSARVYASSKPYDITCALPADARKDGKLRIGYLSSDFHHHATAFLVSELFECHARDRFEIYVYSSGEGSDSPERARIIKSADKFADVHALDDVEGYRRIAEDKLDIMVDLKGYTNGSRLGMLARRPAPLQVHYLAYPGTSGTKFLDYFIADPVAAPPNLDAYFTEKLIRLPHSYQMNDRKRALPANTGNRTTHGLPEKGFVFCGFNRPYKLTPGIYDVWMRLLNAVEGSVLWLCEPNDEAASNLKEEARKRGVNPERVIIAPFANQALHLARYAHADLFLDTFPVCGHTTASDALWCGIPVITLAGESFVSRVAASLLNAVSLPELITNDITSYEALALRLARDPARLAKLKQHLSEGRMRFPLFDSLATTRAIEASYLHMAELHRKGQAPRAFSLMPDLSIKE